MENEIILADNAAISLGANLDALNRRREEIRREVYGATYLDPRYDPGFKKLFGEESALVSFLNAVLRLEDDGKITSLEYKNVEQNIYVPERLELRMDIRAKTATGMNINVEMQKASLTFFRERVISQESAFLCVSKAEFDKDVRKKYPSDSKLDRAARERLRYDIPHTYAIWICDFSINSEEAGHHDSWKIYSEYEVSHQSENDNPLPITEKIKYLLIDLTKFNKTVGELENDEDRWLYLLKNAGISQSLPDFDNSVFEDAIRRLRVDDANNKTTLEAQVACKMSLDEQIGRMCMAVVDAEERGEKRGEERVTRKHVENALRNGKLAVEDIAECNDVTVDYVLEVQSEM